MNPPPSLGPMTLHAEIERWPLTAPFRITGYTWESIEVVSVTLALNGLVGRGEASPVFIIGTTTQSQCCEK